MNVKPGDSITFACFYQNATTGLGVAGLTVTVNVNISTGNVVAGASATALDATNQPGIYIYTYTVPAAYYGPLFAYFATATATVSQRGLASMYISSLTADAASSVWDANVNDHLTRGTMGYEQKWGR